MMATAADKTMRNGGFSLIEVLIVIAITTIGFLALVNLQIGTLRGVGTSRSMMQAVNLSEHFIETLKSEGLPWTGDASILTSQPTTFPHLRLAGSPTEGGGSGWVRAYQSTNSDSRVGPLGIVESDNWDAGAAMEISPERERRFCVHYRLTWVVPNYLIRADVRTLWMRDESNVGLYQDCPVGMETDLANVASVTIPGTVMRNVFAQ